MLGAPLGLPETRGLRIRRPEDELSAGRVHPGHPGPGARRTGGEDDELIPSAPAEEVPGRPARAARPRAAAHRPTGTRPS